ncbi:MAG: hypothetical protein KKA79_02010 [Nanoarchaeota archaeon]|nr:hypothetical protein [Nanoarchaeota archaeon]
MKRAIIGLLILTIFMHSVIAANVYEAEDFLEHPIQMAVLEERDVLKIDWGDKEHQIMVRKIYSDTYKVDLTTFVEGSEVPFYTSITQKTSLDLDFDRDGEYDLKVSIFNLLPDEKFVALNIEVIGKEENKQVIISDTIKIDDQSAKQPINKNIYLLAAFAILIIGVWKRRYILKTYRSIKK